MDSVIQHFSVNVIEDNYTISKIENKTMYSK